MPKQTSTQKIATFISKDGSLPSYANGRKGYANINRQDPLPLPAQPGIHPDPTRHSPELALADGRDDKTPTGKPVSPAGTARWPIGCGNEVVSHTILICLDTRQ